MKNVEELYKVKSQFNERYSVLARKILRILSENSRASISEIAERAEVSRRTASTRLQMLEKEFNIKYVLELNENMLNLSKPHIITVKFKQKPDYERIGKMLLASYMPQLAVAMKGDYDLLIYGNGENAKEYAHWEKGMQILLSEYEANWQTSEVVHRQLGFFPIRNELLDKLEIPKKYKDMLKILNQNSRVSFNEMAKTLGMNVSSVAYNFSRMLKLGYIKRFTISMDPPKDISLITFFAKYAPAKGYEVRSSEARKAFMTDDTNSLVSRYMVTAPLLGSYDFFTLSAFDNLEVGQKAGVRYHKEVFKPDRVKITCASIDRVIFGRLPIRSIDTGAEYNMIRWNI